LGISIDIGIASDSGAGRSLEDRDGPLRVVKTTRAQSRVCWDTSANARRLLGASFGWTTGNIRSEGLHEGDY